MIDLSTIISPNLAKSWIKLATWSFNYGKKISNQLQLTTEIIKNRDNLFLFEYLPSFMPEKEHNFIYWLFTSFLNSIKMFDDKYSDDIKTSFKNYKFNKDNYNIDLSNTDEEIFNIIKLNCPSLTEECIETLINLRRSILSSVYYFKRIACKSFFNYLQLTENEKINNDKEDNNEKKNFDKNNYLMSKIVTTNLYIIKTYYENIQMNLN